MGEALWLELVADEGILALQINHVIQLVGAAEPMFLGANVPKTCANPASIVLATLID
jgi:hypothetical protein